MGGIMNSAEALTAWFNPTVNSYKRINAPVTASGATWAPNTITYSGNNRTHMRLVYAKSIGFGFDTTSKSLPKFVVLTGPKSSANSNTVPSSIEVFFTIIKPSS